MKLHSRHAILLLATVLACACGPSSPPSAGRLHHVGLFWLAEPGNADQRQRLIDAVHAFEREIPEVLRARVGAPLPSESALVDSSFDVAFVLELEDRAALERYAKHPTHEREAREAFLPLTSKLLFYDFVAE